MHFQQPEGEYRRTRGLTYAAAEGRFLDGECFAFALIGLARS